MTAPGQTLETLVRDELRGPVQELVRRLVPELVAETLNGGHHSPPAASNGSAPTDAPSPSTRRCNGCEQHLPTDAFSPMSYTCRECRNARWRERSAARRAAAAKEEPTPG